MLHFDVGRYSSRSRTKCFIDANIKNEQPVRLLSPLLSLSLSVSLSLSFFLFLSSFLDTSRYILQAYISHKREAEQGVVNFEALIQATVLRRSGRSMRNDLSRNDRLGDRYVFR